MSLLCVPFVVCFQNTHTNKHPGSSTPFPTLTAGFGIRQSCVGKHLQQQGSLASALD